MSPTVVWRTKTDDEVYALLFPGRGAIESAHEQPDWARVHGELGRVGVTLKQFGASGRTAFDGEGFDELGHHAPSLAPVLVRVTGDDLLVRAVLYCFNVCWAGSAVFFCPLRIRNQRLDDELASTKTAIAPIVFARSESLLNELLGIRNENIAVLWI